jgi:hypothetical protein
MGKIYEIVDSTSDEMYFTMGLFSELGAAEDAVMGGEPDTLPRADFDGDFIRIEIRERDLNDLTDSLGKTVRTYEWIREYEDGMARWEAI